MKPHPATATATSDRILAIVGAARDVPSGIRYDLEIVDGDERVSAVMMFPHAHRPVPAVLLLHGLHSHKERMADSVGEALVRHGVGALAVDLPMHGGREATDDLRQADALRLLTTWKRAVSVAQVAIEFLATHEQVIAARLGIVGYSLGSFIANIVASSHPSVHAIALAASGDLPHNLPFESLVRAVLDPLRAVQRTGGRPVLMINGRYDRTVTPAQAERLFAAAPEPKMMRWYLGGHWPPADEIEFAAQWLAQHLGASAS